MFCLTIDLKKYVFPAMAFYCLAMAVSCREKPERTTLYDIDSLVTLQINYLSAKNARLHKVAILGGESDTTSFTPGDTAAWSEELNIFRQLDQINKPVNRTSYLVDDGLMDPASNLTVKAFSSTKELPVIYLRVFYQESVHNPRKIEALYDEKNSLYKSARRISMEFNQIDNKAILTSYSIDGGQKMMFGDSVAFVLKGTILLD